MAVGRRRDLGAGSRATSQIAGSAATNPSQATADGRSPRASPTTTRHEHGAHPRDGRHDAHPSGGQAAVEERGADAVADPGQQAQP